jgi:hypothetical protein
LVVGAPQQPSVDGLEIGAGRHPELLAEQDPQPLVGAERLGEVAAPRQRLHQEVVPGLAEGASSVSILARSSDWAKAEADGGEALQPAQPHLLRPAAPLVDPGGFKPVRNGLVATW